MRLCTAFTMPKQAWMGCVCIVLELAVLPWYAAYKCCHAVCYRNMQVKFCMVAACQAVEIMSCC